SHWALRYDEDGKPATVIEVNNDITEVKKVQDELWKQQEAFRALADHSPDSIDRLDREFRHIYVNTAAARMLGTTPERVIGKKSREIGMSAPRADIWEARIRQVFETNQPLEADDSFPTAKGGQFFNTRCVPEHAADGTVISVLAVSRDITERRRAE